MSNFTRKEDMLYVYSGVNVFTRNPISYNYFVKNFSHTIDFLNKATVLLTYTNIKEQQNEYQFYTNFLKRHKRDFKLSEEQSILVLKEGSIKISLILLVMSHYWLKIRATANTLTSIDRYTDNFIGNILSDNAQKQADNYEILLKSLGKDITEVFRFKDSSVINALKSDNPGNPHKIITIVDNIRYLDSNPMKRDECEKRMFGMDSDMVEYEGAQISMSLKWQYILFNLIFLSRKYILYFSTETVINQRGFAKDWFLIDRKGLDEFLSNDVSGIIINCSLSPALFDNSLQEDAEFNALRKEIQSKYEQLFEGKLDLAVMLNKLSHHIEEQIRRFGNINFMITTKAHMLHAVKDLVTVSDAKKFYEIEQKLGGYDEEKTTKQGGKKVRILHKKRKIEDL